MLHRWWLNAAFVTYEGHVSHCDRRARVVHRVFKELRLLRMGRDSSVGIATRYGLDGPRIESRWGRDFPHPSRPVLGPTQPPIQWVPGLSGG